MFGTFTMTFLGTVVVATGFLTAAVALFDVAPGPVGGTVGVIIGFSETTDVVVVD